MNDGNRKQIIVLVILVVVAGFFVVKNLGGIAGGGGAPANATAAAGSGGGSGIVEFKSVFDDVDIDIPKLIQNIKEVEFDYAEMQIARDPSIPILKGTVTSPINPPFPVSGPSIDPDSLVYLARLKEVTGIIFDDTNPMAVIDTDVVYIGYEFRETPDSEAIIVKSIGTDFVVLSIPSEDEEVTKELVKEQ